MKRRILSLLLVFAMLIGMFPTTALATDGATGKDENVVYLSISFDGKYIDDKDGKPIVYRAISLDEIANINLDEVYNPASGTNLGNMKFDSDGDGEYEITALQLIIYAHENLYGGTWSNVNFADLPGSSYFQGGVFGFTENLMYFHNGGFPVDESQTNMGYITGATSDRIVLEPGDFLDIASFGCYSFLWDMLGGFHGFGDVDAPIDEDGDGYYDGEYRYDYTVEAGKELSFKLLHSFADLMSGMASIYIPEDYEVYYGTKFGEAEGSVFTDENGDATISFAEAGTYYIWCDGDNGSDDGTHGSCSYCLENGEPCIVSAPTYAKVTVTGGSEPTEPECEHVWEDANCTAPKTCSVCGETEGSANGHSWNAASCENPKTCSVCDATEGQALGHNWENGVCQTCGDGCEHNWVPATCTAAKTCEKCEYTEGEALDHDWKSGSCTRCDEVWNVKTILNDTMTKLAETVSAPSFGTNYGEWTVFSLARGNHFTKDNKYFTDYYNRIVDTVNETAASVNKNGALDANKSTDNSRLIVALSAIGKDANFVGDWDIAGAYSANGINWIRKQGLNGTIWALIALDSNNYKTEDSTLRQQCVDAIVSAQHNDGGWSLVTAKTQPSNIDITGMALTALYPYRDQPAVAKVCDEAFAWLSESQLDNGGFPYGSNGETVESCAWVIVAASTHGINPHTDPRFIKNGYSAVDSLISYYVEDEAMFEHSRGAGVNAMATDQSTYALVAYNRLLEGKSALYDFSDVGTICEGHTYEDATCTAPKTCTKCSYTEGEVDPNKHSWIDATCVAPKTCSECETTEGGIDAAAHNYVDGKCTLCDAVKPSAPSGGSGGGGGSSSGGGSAAGGGAVVDGSANPKVEITTPEPTPEATTPETTPESTTPDNSKDNSTEEKKVVASVESKENTKGGETKATVSEGVVNAAIQAVVEAVKNIVTEATTPEADSSTGETSKTETTVEVKPEVKIEIKGDETTKKVETQIPVAATKEIVKNENMALTLDTPVGVITFDNNALSMINDNAASENVSFHVESKDVEGRPAVELNIKTDNDTKVTNFGKGRVNVAVPYTLRPGEIGAGLIVRYIDDNGNKTDMPTTYDAKTGKVSFTTNHFSTYVVDYDENLAKNAVSFTDVKSGDWFSESVMALAAKGIITGKTESTFAPNDNITRAEFVTILARMSGQNMPQATGKFADVKAADWFAQYVAWAAEAGIVNGTSADAFSPNAKISRQDMAVMIKRYADFMSQNLEETNTAVNFTDAASIAGYAKDAVATMHKAGIINGIKATNGSYSFAPANNATRAEAAKMIYQLIK